MNICCTSSLHHKWYVLHRYLLSFPTRRSSDLRARGPRRRHAPAGTRRHPQGHYPRESGGLSAPQSAGWRSEEHTSELQSLTNLVCRLLLEKKKEIMANLEGSIVDSLYYGTALI